MFCVNLKYHGKEENLRGREDYQWHGHKCFCCGFDWKRI